MNENDKKLAIDIWLHLNYISPYKPTLYLTATREAALKERERPFVAKWDPRLSEELSRHLDLIPRPTHHEIARSALAALAIGDHREAKPIFDQLTDQPLPNSHEVGYSVRFFAKHDEYARAFDIAEKHALRILTSGTYREVSEFTDNIIELRHPDGNHQDQRWMSDEYVRARWPEFIHAIDLLMVDRFGPGHGRFLSAELESIRPRDYRTRPDVTTSLARAYDKDVVKWAMAEIDMFLNSDSDLDDDLLDLPTDILLIRYSRHNKEIFESVDRLFCADKRSRYKIIARTGLFPSHRTEDLLFRIAQYDGLEGYEPMYVRQTIAMFVGYNREKFLKNQRSWVGGDAEDLLVSFVRGERIQIDERDKEDRGPIVCK